MRLLVSVVGVSLVVWFRMDMILKKVEEMMKEKKMEVSKFPPCEELQISLLRWAGGRGRKERRKKE